MDPLTIAIIITLVVLSSAGIGATITRRRNALERLRLTDSLQSHRRLEDQRLSIFDVFWDLGASEFALELMAHHHLLPRNDREVLNAWNQLEELISQHGSYIDFLSDSLDAIQEFYDEHTRSGHRRLLPGLSEASSRTLPVPPRSATSLDRPTEASIHERRTFREGRSPLGLVEQGQADSIDIDRVGDFSAQDLLQSLLDGNLANHFNKWWKLRRLRQLRQALDTALEALYDFYADLARRNATFYDPLYDTHHRWQDEATRLRMYRKTRQWADKPFAPTADLLFEQAISLAEHLAHTSYQTTFQAIEAIHDHVRDGNKAMGGYLVYLNRHPFFAGRFPDYARYIRDVDFATQRVREEHTALRNEGLI